MLTRSTLCSDAERHLSHCCRRQVSVLSGGEKARSAPAKFMPTNSALLSEGWQRLSHCCWRQVSVLSGGEKARLALAKFMLTRGSLLVLDEPTNHLDIPSKETLEEALRSFQGSVIAVSHDRYFLKQIATRIVAVSACKA